MQHALRNLLTEGPLTSLDFTGLEQLTDEAFIILGEVTSEIPNFQSSLLTVKCVGCIHITDAGILCLASSFPTLQQVIYLFWIFSILCTISPDLCPFARFIGRLFLPGGVGWMPSADRDLSAASFGQVSVSFSFEYDWLQCCPRPLA